MEADYKQRAYQIQESNETLQVLSHSREYEESQGRDSKQSAIDETIKMLAVEHRMLEKKVGETDFAKVISTTKRDDFSEKALLKHVRYLGACIEIYRSIVQKCLAEYMIGGKMFRPATVGLAAGYMSEM